MGRGFLFEPCLRHSMGCGLLRVGREVLPGLRVVEPQPAFFVEPHVESERFAVQAQPAPPVPSRRTAAADIRPRAGETPASAERAARSPSASLCRLSPPPTIATDGSGRYSPPCRRQAGRVEQPVLPHAQGCIHLALASLILLPGAARRDLQDEVRRLGLFPELVRHALVHRRPDHDEYVRRDHGPGIALLVVEEHVPGDVDLLAVMEVGAQRGDRVDEGFELEVALRHRLPVRAGVVNRGGSCHGSVHRRVLRCDASARLGMHCATVP